MSYLLRPTMHPRQECFLTLGYCSPVGRFFLRSPQIGFDLMQSQCFCVLN